MRCRTAHALLKDFAISIVRTLRERGHQAYLVGGVPVEDGRKALHDLISVGIPGIWLFPDTDYIGSFAPFSNLPTQYRITVDGEQKWFGQ